MHFGDTGYGDDADIVADCDAVQNALFLAVSNCVAVENLNNYEDALNIVFCDSQFWLESLEHSDAKYDCLANRLEVQDAVCDQDSVADDIRIY